MTNERRPPKRPVGGVFLLARDRAAASADEEAQKAIRRLWEEVARVGDGLRAAIARKEPPR